MFGFSYLVIKLNLNRDPGLSPALNLKSLIWFFTEIGGRIKVQKAKARVKLFTCIRRLHSQKVWNFAMQFLLLLPVLIDLLERGGVHKTCGMFATSYLQIKGLIMKQRCCKTKQQSTYIFTRCDGPGLGIEIKRGDERMSGHSTLWLAHGRQDKASFDTCAL